AHHHYPPAAATAGPEPSHVVILEVRPKRSTPPPQEEGAACSIRGERARLEVRDMLGRRGLQRGLFEADTLYSDFVGRDTFYGWLAAQRGELFPDELFLGLYIDGWGRPSVPPSLLATALVLQTYDGVSDEEANRRAAYDP